MNHKRARLFWIVGVVGFMALIAGGLAYVYSGSDSQATSSASSPKRLDQPTQNSSYSKATTKSSTDAIQSSQATVQTDLTGIGFQIMPVRFNGEDVTQAMEENKAPQNTVHDGAQLGYFKNATQARLSGLARYFYARTDTYAVRQDILYLGSWRIPLSIANGIIQATQWDTKDLDGNTITWKIEPLQDAQTQVEAHANPNESSSDANTASVDQHNLTSAQMEHWVRSYLQSLPDAYDASEYTFTQKFVDGYAQVYAYQDNAKTGKKELSAVYRVDENGDLQVSSQPESSGWRTVSRQYR